VRDIQCPERKQENEICRHVSINVIDVREHCNLRKVLQHRKVDREGPRNFPDLTATGTIPRPCPWVPVDLVLPERRHVVNKVGEEETWEDSLHGLTQDMTSGKACRVCAARIAMRKVEDGDSDSRASNEPKAHPARVNGHSIASNEFEVSCHENEKVENERGKRDALSLERKHCAGGMSYCKLRKSRSTHLHGRHYKFSEVT
jgi:hypothetical protein